MTAQSRVEDRLWFNRLAWTEIDQVDRSRAILLLPVGSTEAHGPHLPLSTDVIISEELCLRAARRLVAIGWVPLVLPSIGYTVTDFGAGFSGSISISPSTATAFMVEILGSLVSQGFLRFGVANSHLEPAHVDCIEAAINRIHQERGIAIAFPDIRRRRWVELLTEEFKSGQCHAGQFETSLVLAATRALVREEILPHLPRVRVSLSEAIRNNATSFKQAGGSEAYFGDPASATAAEGENTFDALANILIVSLQETYPEIRRESMR